jgi:hypothetical protein
MAVTRDRAIILLEQCDGHAGKVIQMYQPTLPREDPEMQAAAAAAAEEKVAKKQEKVAKKQEKVAKKLAAKKRKAGAAASFARAKRSAGLRVGGLQHEHPSLRGVFTRDTTDPDANGRPHWSTAEGGHLYYSVDGKWFMNPGQFTPDETGCTAYCETAGAVPAGEAAWQCHWAGHVAPQSRHREDGSEWVTRTLTVAELSPARRPKWRAQRRRR